MSYIEYCHHLIDHIDSLYSFNSIALHPLYEFDKIDMMLYKDSYGIFLSDDILKRAYYFYQNIDIISGTDLNFIEGIIEEHWLGFLRRERREG